jgi:polyvinyl alcohol dehydrogenase (cytochrome)
LTSGQQINWGSWSALDVNTGNILWQTADPTTGTIDTGSVSVANGVMYAGSYSGQMYALNTETGAILWNFASGGSVIDGPSIVDGTLYWGSGYRNIPPGIGNNKVYAFTLAGGKDRGEPSGNQGAQR